MSSVRPSVHPSIHPSETTPPNLGRGASKIVLIMDVILCQKCPLLKPKKRFGRKQEDGIQWIRYVGLEMSINCVSDVMFTCFKEKPYSTLFTELFTERGHVQNSAGHERSQPHSWLLLVLADPNSLSFVEASVVGTF